MTKADLNGEGIWQRPNPELKLNLSTLQEAIAHFYDNEFDSEFGIGSSTKYKTKIRKKTGEYDKLYFKCCRSGTKTPIGSVKPESG